MKSSTIVKILIAVSSCLAIGIATLSIGLTLDSKYKVFDYKNEVYSVEKSQLEGVENLSLKFLATSLNAEFYDGDSLYIEYHYGTNKDGKRFTSLEKTFENGTLSFEEKKQKKFPFSFNLSLSKKRPDTVIKIPKWLSAKIDLDTTTGDVVFKVQDGQTANCEDLQVEATTGDITFGQADTRYNFLKNLLFSTTTGDIKLVGTITVGNSLSVSTTTGDVSLCNISAEEIFVGLTTGDIKFNGVINATKTLTAKTSSGDVEINQEITANTLVFKSTTGYVDANAKITAVDKLTITSTTGNSKFEKEVIANKVEISHTTGSANFALLSANDIKITTTSGNIKVKLSGKKSNYTLILDGNSNVDSSLGGSKTFSAKTTSGKITLTFEKA